MLICVLLLAFVGDYVILDNNNNINITLSSDNLKFVMVKVFLKYFYECVSFEKKNYFSIL